MSKVTENMRVVYGALKAIGNSGFAKEVLNRLTADGATDKTFNGVNATLAALAGKGIVSKEKAVYDEKMYTKYSIVKELEVKVEAEVE